MIGRGRIFVLGACLALATVSLSTPMHAYAAPVASQVGSNIGVISDVPLAETATESEVEQPAKVPSTTIQPDTVASGYRLVGERVTDYRYMSKNGYAGAYHCPGNGQPCTLQAEVSMHVQEVVEGGSSKHWHLTQYAQSYKNPGRLSWTYRWTYYCAVNVRLEADHYCGDGAYPSGESHVMDPGVTVSRRFETRNSGKDYPMVGIFVHFSDGVVAGGKFREWDTCNTKSSTKLCKSTGKG